MIQNNTYLNVIDNSGARFASCIKIIQGYKNRYASIGDTILVSIKNLRNKRRSTSKVKKGEIYKALILRTKTPTSLFSGDKFSFFENNIALLNKKNKFIGTRIFGGVPKQFRFSKYLKVVSLSLGLIA